MSIESKPFGYLLDTISSKNKKRDKYKPIIQILTNKLITNSTKTFGYLLDTISSKNKKREKYKFDNNNSNDNTNDKNAYLRKIKKKRSSYSMNQKVNDEIFYDPYCHFSELNNGIDPFGYFDE